ncbi:MAG: hypothetical protein GF308_03080 [Candidatus Heimdallarchaeota archaeon]|nr:hypothetical protein [Candidatus Heimdallarchaeota archaeon]
MQLSQEEITQKYNTKLLKSVGIYQMIVSLFNRKLFKAIDYAYPGQYKPWHFRKMRNVWVGEKGRKNSIEAIKEMIKTLAIDLEDLPKVISIQTFADYGLLGMLSRIYGSSPYKAINAAYPGRFHPWEFKLANYWSQQNIATARKATKWLVEEKLKLNKKELFSKIQLKDFIENGLLMMLKVFYQGSYYNALKDCYDL